MTVDESGPRESASVRLAAPAAGAVLAATTFGAMLGVPSGPVQSAVVVAAVLAQGATIVGRAWWLRGVDGRPDLSWRAHQFVVLWSVQAGLTYLVAGEDTAASAAIYVATGLLFAVPLTLYLAWSAGREPLDDPKPSTEPLPIPDDDPPPR